VFDDLGERGPTGRAEPLEAGELRLGRDARGARGVDQRAAVRGDRAGRARSGRPVGGCGAERLRPESRRVGIEAQDDLGLAPGDRVGEPVGDVRPGGRRVGPRRRSRVLWLLDGGRPASR
jgi:hypothetical protein